MNKKILFLIVAILSAIIFMSAMSEIFTQNPDPETIFGSVWIHRLLWLVSTIVFTMFYFRERRDSK